MFRESTTWIGRFGVVVVVVTGQAREAEGAEGRVISLGFWHNGTLDSYLRCGCCKEPKYWNGTALALVEIPARKTPFE